MSLAFNLLNTTATGGRRAQLHLPHQTVETPGLHAGRHGRHRQSRPAGRPRIARRRDHSRQYLSSLSAPRTRGHPPHGRPAPIHQLAARHAHRLRRLSGFQPHALRKVTDEGVRFRSHLDGSSHFFTPEHSMDVQIALGADICMAFDECTEYPADRNRAEESLRLTMAWARRSLDHFRAHQHEVPWHEDRVPQVSNLRPGMDDRTQKPLRHRAGRHVPRPAPRERRAPRRDGLRRLRHRRPQRGRAARTYARNDRRSAAAAARKTSRAT